MCSACGGGDSEIDCLIAVNWDKFIQITMIWFNGLFMSIDRQQRLEIIQFNGIFIAITNIIF